MLKLAGGESAFKPKVSRFNSQKSNPFSIERGSKITKNKDFTKALLNSVHTPTLYVDELDIINRRTSFQYDKVNPVIQDPQEEAFKVQQRSELTMGDVSPA